LCFAERELCKVHVPRDFPGKAVFEGGV
jgi:hypothetical protein